MQHSEGARFIMQKKLVTIIGARPQFIKAAIVSRHLRQYRGFQEIMVHTGQHYDENMSAIFFKELEMQQPDYHLAIGSSSHGAQTGRMMESIEKVLLDVKPEGILIYGDTNSTLAGALVASKLHIPVFHIEAGLRSFNMKMPEEINRIVADCLSRLLFAPTMAAVKNLEKEGVAPERVFCVGDVMYDVTLYYGEKADSVSGKLSELNLNSKDYILTTIHRAENTDIIDRLLIITDALIEISKTNKVVLPLHPRTRAILLKCGLLEKIQNALVLIDPLGFLDMLQLEKHAKLIITDSGGVQKEAFFHQVPCVTLRDETEWVELIDLGWNRLIKPTSVETIIEGVQQKLNAPLGQHAEPYGDGRSAEKIVDLIAKTI